MVLIMNGEKNLPKYFKKNINIAIEKFKISTLVLNYISSLDEQKYLKILLQF